MEYPTTDAGNSMRFAALFADEVRWDPDVEVWLVWDGRRWRRQRGETRLQEKAKHVVVALLEEAALATDEASMRKLSKWAHESQSGTRIQAMVKLARSERQLWTSLDEYDSHDYLVNFRNGTFDVRTNQLRPHDPSDLITALCEVDYVADARAPLWRDVLTQGTDCDSSGDTAVFVEMVLGYALIGNNEEQRLFIFNGAPNSGKSLIAETVYEVMGSDYCVLSKPNLVMKVRGERHSSVIQGLVGKRYTVVSETSSDMELDEAHVKDLVGARVTSTRALYRETKDVRTTWTPLVVTNAPPSIQHWDKALARRIVVVPFGPSIPDYRRIGNLADRILAEEREGVVASLMAGAHRWWRVRETERSGFRHLPAAVKQATDAVAHENDAVLEFVDARLDLVPGSREPNRKLYEAFKVHRASMGDERPLGSQGFYKRLAEVLSEKGADAARRDRDFSGVVIRPIAPWLG